MKLQRPLKEAIAPQRQLGQVRAPPISSMEPIPPAAAAPHLVAARQLHCLSATRGGTAHLARC
jgi:hypothetical protein